MPERPVSPPLRKPVSEQRTPNHRDGFFTELIHRDDPMYQQNAPFKRGTRYNSLIGAKQEVIDLFPDLRLVKSVKPGNMSDFGNTDQYLILLWSTDETAESTYNAEITYLAENVSYPSFARVYTIPRATYEATPTIATGTPLTALIGIKVTAGGANYTSATIGIAGTGSGATAEAVIAGGAIQEIIITNEGTGYTAAPPITITGDGAGATATGIIQPQTAVLISQKKSELPDDSLFRNEWVSVLRIYSEITGPVLTGLTQNSNGAAGTITTQLVAAGAPADSGADVLESTVSPKTSLQSEKETRTGALWSNTTGKGLGELALPTTITEAVVDKANAASVVGAIDTESWASDPQDAQRNHERKVTAPYSTTTITAADVNARGDTVSQVITWSTPNTALPAETNLIHVKRDLETQFRARQTVETASANSTLTDKRYEKEAFGAEIDIAEDIINPASVAMLPALDLTTWDAFVDHTRKNEARKVISTVIGGLPTKTEYDQDEEYQSLITTVFNFVLNVSITPPSAVAGVRTRYDWFDKTRSIQIVRTRANPGGSSGTLAKTRYIKGQYTFPTLLYGRSAALYVDPVTGATKLAWNPTILRARSRRVTFKIEDFFYTTSPAQDTEFNPIGTDYEYNGIMFDVSIANAICDGGFNLQYSSSGIVETFTFGASPTTLATYLTKVGVWTIITSEVTPWHDGFFLKRNTSLKFQE